jgi:hypothetical protein
METFTITAYNAATDVATVTFVVNSRTNFTGGTFAGIKVSGVPKDSVANVKAFMRRYVEALIAGRQSENIAQANPSAEVVALLNVATEF